MRQGPILTAALLLALAGGCATSDTYSTGSTASTMTRSPADYDPDERVYVRPARTRTRAYSSSDQPAVSIQPQQPMSRAERAMAVLRRSPLGRLGRGIRGIFLGPSNPAPQSNLGATGTTVSTGEVIVGQPVETGSGIRSSVTGTPVEQVPGMRGATALAPTATPAATTTAATPVAQPTMAPGAGRVIVGPATGGLRSTVTGTPVEPIPGVTPAAVPIQPAITSMNPAQPVSTGGTAAAASAPLGATIVLAAPPVTAIAPAEPAPGTSVKNVKASESTVEIQTEPDGTPVIVNTEETPEPEQKNN
jgi:hypothetical protein